jgi:hypothetical protein
LRRGASDNSSAMPAGHGGRTRVSANDNVTHTVRWSEAA